MIEVEENNLTNKVKYIADFWGKVRSSGMPCIYRGCIEHHLPKRPSKVHNKRHFNNRGLSAGSK
jgi:hypothetical protein